MHEVSKFCKGPDFTVNVQMTVFYVWDRGELPVDLARILHYPNTLKRNPDIPGDRLAMGKNTQMVPGDLLDMGKTTQRGTPDLLRPPGHQK